VLSSRGLWSVRMALIYCWEIGDLSGELADAAGE
jgi:hypothetical protein